MAVITDYGTLKTAVADYLARSDLTTFVPNFIQAAEARINREFRVRYMNTSLDIVVPAGLGTAAIPLDYLEARSMTVTTVNPFIFMRRVSREEGLRLFPRGSTTGAPQLWSMTTGANILVHPTTNTEHTLNLSYYARTVAMSANSDHPWFIDYEPDLILYASLVGAEPFIKNDPRIQTWEQLYQIAKTQIYENDKREEMAGSKLRASVR